MATGGSDKPAELQKIGSNLIQNVKTKEVSFTELIKTCSFIK